MASPGFAAIKSPSASGLVLILPVLGQKVKSIGPGALEIPFGSRQQEPARTTDWSAITARLGHNLNASL